MKQQKLNCIGPSPADSRDFPPPSLTAKRQYVDYRRYNRIAETQTTNDCTMNGNEGLLQVPINKLRNVDIDNGSSLVDLDALRAYRELCALKYNGANRGAYPRDTMDYLLKTGMVEISPEAGTVHKIREYWRNKTIFDIHNSLLAAGPQTVSTEWMYSFADCKDNGGLIVPKPRDFRVGFHQTCIQGFIPKNGDDVYVVRNSHGLNFGDMGYFYIKPDDLNRILVESYGGLYDADLEQLAERWMEL